MIAKIPQIKYTVSKPTSATGWFIKLFKTYAQEKTIDSFFWFVLFLLLDKSN